MVWNKGVLLVESTLFYFIVGNILYSIMENRLLYFNIKVTRKEVMFMLKVTEIFGSYVFDDATMKERLPKSTYRELKKTIDTGAPLNNDVADDVALAMKDWAIELGATHYTHVFIPLTESTAEKHDSFITPIGGGRVMMEFTGKELLRAEPDASSFPSGGIRDTCAARGYTAWDCTSPAYVKTSLDGCSVLCIPTAFTSYTGESLDFKTPLLRSMDALNKEAKRVLAYFDKEPAKVTANVGPEQEYFLVDKAKYMQRADLKLTGRTLFGAPAPKGQELDDQYFGTINEKVSVFMSDLNQELWKYGITAKTQHNEVAPAQHEVAPIFGDTNIASDNNHLLMETLQKVALRDDLACLLYEKPFAGVNGSGKHNNWSFSTSDGENLMNPGPTPENNIQFQLFLAAVLAAVDNNAEILRLSASSAGNDHRLGANEAPPAIISVFLGEQLEGVVKQIIEKGEATSSIAAKMYESGVSTLPSFQMDATDRNRTSPFAFTGNRFEFRMVGSSQTIAMPTMMLNTIVANELALIADQLDAAEDKEACIKSLIRDLLTKHQRIIFNGNGYSQEWVEEAAKRGLPNIPCMVEAVPYLTTDKTIEVFKRMGVMDQVELAARAEVMLENYAKKINIEARTMIEMANKQIIPAVMSYEGKLATEAKDIAAIGVEPKAQKELLEEINRRLIELKAATAKFTEIVDKGAEYEDDISAWAKYFHNEVFLYMPTVREPADALELLVSKSAWPFPTYGDLLFEQ